MKKFLSMILIVATIWIGIGSEAEIASDREIAPEPFSIIKVDKF